MKVVINVCFGGFSVTKPVYDELGIEWKGHGYLENEDLGIESENYNAYRANPYLIRAIEEVGLERSAGRSAKLKIIDTPDEVDWEITDYDGWERVEEVHRWWG